MTRVAQLVFTPPFATWSIRAGIVVATRSTDPRTAGRLPVLASLLTVAVIVLIAFH